MKPLPRSFYRRSTLRVAKALLGKNLVRVVGGHILAGRIVETEAYFGQDRASHSYRGPTKRSQPMFEEAGHAYVYFVYGNHYCFNVVTEKVGRAGAVLIRALEPVSGMRRMVLNRNGIKDKGISNGPGKLCQAFAIDKKFNRADLTGKVLFITDGEDCDIKVVRTTRIGISEAKEKPYRFYIKSNEYVSRK
ncbi:MAG: DNA-3-methyladenine glycosylase [bacterium]